MSKNGPLVALVAAVAVAAVPVGGAVASRQVTAPVPAGTAVPVPAATTPGPATTPTVRPAPKPTATPSRVVSQLPTLRPTVRPTSTPSMEPSRTELPGPIRRSVDAAKLPMGRAPQLAYLQGREVSGGAAPPVTVPGTSRVSQVAQVGRLVLAAVVADDNGTTELLTLDGRGVLRRTPAVWDIVTSADHSSGAYLSDPMTDGGGELAGGTLYALTRGNDSPKRLDLPGRWNISLLGYVGDRVYFRSSASDKSDPQLFTWTPGRAEPQLIKTVPFPSAVSPDGKLAVGLTELVDFGSCSHLIEIATGKRLWRTCEYMINGFTPDGRTVFGPDAQSGDGFAPQTVAALDAKTGTTLRIWDGVALQVAAEDDQNLLIHTDEGPDEGDKNAIVRCSVPTGRCELATSNTVPQKLISK